MVDFWQPQLGAWTFFREIACCACPGPSIPWRSPIQVLSRVGPALLLRSDEIGLDTLNIFNTFMAIIYGTVTCL